MSNTSRTNLRPAAGNSGTSTPTATQTILATPSIPINTLRLRAEPEERRRIQWAEDVIDNEGMGKKKSKVCCIYHKPREPGDSDTSDSDSSSSESDEDDEPDLSRAQRAGGGRGRGRRHDCADHDGEGNTGGSGKGKERKASPNAYERQPKQKSKKDG